MRKSSSYALRAQIEADLADRIPSALTPAQRIIRPVATTGISIIDGLLEGGLPLGAITEIVGPECSGRTALALSFITQLTKAARVCAWIDVSNVLHPESASAAGVDLARLLWVRCGVSTPSNVHDKVSPSGFEFPEKYFVPSPVKKGLHGGGFGPHPRTEVKGLSNAVSGLLRPEIIVTRCAESQRRIQPNQASFQPCQSQRPKLNSRPTAFTQPWSRIGQALRVTDLVLQAGGFSAVVLDMGSIAPEYVLRVPLSTWFRYRAAAERTQTIIVLLTQQVCAKSSAELVLRLQRGNTLQQETTVFSGTEHTIEISRQRFNQPSTKIIPLRKPPQREKAASWSNKTSWAGRR